MNVAYAQAADRQGLNAAANGQVVAPDEASFVELREKAISLNFTTTPRLVGDVEVRYGKGVIRLEFKGADDGATQLSPIVVVVDAADVVHDRETAALRALESVAAIGRQCDVQEIVAGLAVGEQFHRSIRTKRRVATVVSSALIAVAIVWVARSCTPTADMFSSARSRCR